MKQTNKVALLPEVYDFLDVLAQTLLEKDYVSYIEHGENIVDDIIDFVKTIPYAPHYHLTTLKSISADTGRIYNIPFLKGKVVSIPLLYIFFLPAGRLIYSTFILLTTTKTANTYMPPSRRRIDTPFQQPKPNPAIQTLSLLAIFSFQLDE